MILLQENLWSKPLIFPENRFGCWVCAFDFFLFFCVIKASHFNTMCNFPKGIPIYLLLETISLLGGWHPWLTCLIETCAAFLFSNFMQIPPIYSLSVLITLLSYGQIILVQTYSIKSNTTALHYFISSYGANDPFCWKSRRSWKRSSTRLARLMWHTVIIARKNWRLLGPSDLTYGTVPSYPFASKFLCRRA